MHTLFADMFNREPNHIIDGDYYFGDAPSDSDEKFASGKFDGIANEWEEKRKKIYDRWPNGLPPFEVCDEIATHIAQEGKPFMEIAVGCNLGLSPAILTKNPTIPCMLNDIHPAVVRACRHYIDRQLPESNISLAGFDVVDIPMKDASFDYVISRYGLGSAWFRNEAGLKAVNEVYRMLKSGGVLVAMEYEWEHNEAAAEWVRLSEESPETELTKFMRSSWECMLYKKGLTWASVLEAAGFTVEQAESCGCFKTQKRNIGFGSEMQTIHLSSEQHLKRTLFIARKP